MPHPATHPAETLKLASHLIHLLVEAALGVLALLLVAVCVLAWRLAQGPIDLTALMHREQALFAIPGAQLAFGGADLAWEGFSASNQPLVVRLRDVSLVRPDDGPRIHVDQVRVRFAEAALLLGRVTPRGIFLQNVAVTLHRKADGSFALGPPAGPGGRAQWPRALGQVTVRDAKLIVHDEALGLDWGLSDLGLALTRAPGSGVAGQGQAELQAGSLGTQITVRAAANADKTQLTLAMAEINPSAIAPLVASFAPLARVNAPVAARLGVTLDGALTPLEGRLDLSAGPGNLAAGEGAVHLAHAKAALWANASELRLEHAEAVLARQDAPGGASTITATGRVTRGERVHAAFGVDLDGVALADLQRYWPAGAGGGARTWLTRNVTAGSARDAHLTAELDAAPDLSGATLTALSGGLSLDDATVWWLRPVPPIIHAGGRLVVEGPDAVRITIQNGAQDRISLRPGSSIRITGLQARDQFADIDASLSGPAADALALLDHPRLKLLSRGGVAIVEPAGTMRAQLTLHVPLENRVSIDDIPISATAALSGLHLGRIVAGRDLDGADLSAKVTGQGLRIDGTGAVAGIPARLALDMDFRGGPPGQLMQHLTAQGAATADQLLAAGLPAAAVHVLTGGSAGLRVDYTSRRASAAILQIDADLAQASVATALGWSKKLGQPASAGGRITLDHGQVSSVDDLHAEGPGLAIVSHATVSPHARNLVLQRMELGRTSAHGAIGFPQNGGPVAVALSGASLDLSAMFAKSETRPATRPDAAAADDKPGLPWSAKLDFGRVFLANGVGYAPLHVNAASDGRRMLHASVSAGAGLTASITPGAGHRRIAAAAANAGEGLAAFGVGGLSGGVLSLDGSFDDTKTGSPLAGTVNLDNFNIRDAPAIGRLLQVMTLYGVADTMHGPGLHFSHLVAPFRWRGGVLHLSNARAFSPSLGVTADGDIDTTKRTADMRGTVVPAYFFNQLLGDLPLIGRLFSPEKGGGLFAARYSVRGPLADPKIGVNPLSALTPGFLRGVFGLFDRRQ